MDERSPDRFAGPRKYRGIRISSRYDKMEEIRTLIAIVDRMPADLERHVDAIFCDSKACAAYLVTTHAPRQAAEMIADRCHDILIHNSGGYNELTIDFIGGSTERGSHWEGDGNGT